MGMTFWPKSRIKSNEILFKRVVLKSSACKSEIKCNFKFL